MKQITPVIKRTRVKTEKFEVCPHCRQEIREKEHYVDPENYVYHRPCQDKGPIDQIKPLSEDEFNKMMKGSGFLNQAAKPAETQRTAQVKNGIEKTAGGYPVKDTAGVISRNVAGKDYQFIWKGSIGLVKGDRSHDAVVAEKPSDMPDYLWFQVKDSIEDEAMKIAVKKTVDHLKQQQTVAKSSWLERAGLEKTAQPSEPEDRQLPAAAAKPHKGGKKSPKQNDQPIDEVLLADGLGAFLDVFVNYHTGKEGDLLTKWVVALCDDQKYSEVAKKLEQLHKLIGEVYKDVVDIASQDEMAMGKVAAVLAKIKTAQRMWTKDMWEETCGFYDSEQYVVSAIRQHLLSEEHRQEMFNRNVTISDVLNGRVEGEDAEEFTGRLFADWNAKLGWHQFGY